GKGDPTVMRALVAACAAAAVCFSTSPAVLAAPTPYSPETREAWVNPLARAGENSDLRIDVTRTPDVVHAGEGMRLGLTVSNSSEETVSDLRVTARRGDPTWTVEEARRVLALDTGAYPWEEIGRASCREREQSEGDGAAVKREESE